MTHIVLNPDGMVSNTGWDGTPDDPDLHLNIDGAVWNTDGPSDFDEDTWIQNTDSTSVFRVTLSSPSVSDVTWDTAKIRIWQGRVDGTGSQGTATTLYVGGSDEGTAYQSTAIAIPGGQGSQTTLFGTLGKTSAQMEFAEFKVEMNAPYNGRNRITGLQLLLEGVATFNETIAGGGLLGGAAVVSPTYNISATGGALAGGLGKITPFFELTTGGVLAGGVPVLAFTYNITSLGGALGGGVALDTHSYNPPITGGGLLGGAAVVSPTYNINGTGGAIVAGVAFIPHYVTGGALAGGVAKVTPFNERGTGGALASGRVPYHNFPVVGGGVICTGFVDINAMDVSGGALVGGLAAVTSSTSIIATGGAICGFGFQNGFKFRRLITVPAGKVGTDIVKFYLGVTACITSARVETGTDFRFETLDGTRLYHELRSWTAGNGRLVAFVKVPLLADADNSFYLYYGNPTA